MDLLSLFGGQSQGMGDPDMMAKMGLIASLFSARKGSNIGEPFMQYAQSQQTAALRKLQQQVLAQNLQSGGIDLKAKDQAFQDSQQARDVLKSLYGPQSQPANPGFFSDPESAGLNAAIDASQGAPQPQQPQQPPQQFQPPQGIAPSGMPATMKAPGGGTTLGPAGSSQGKFDTFNKYNAVADALEQKGLVDQARQYRDLAEKYRPVLKDEQVRLINGQPQVVRNYQDGTTEVSPYQPTKNTEYIDTGNAKLPVDKYTGGMSGQPIPMGMSPADAARIGIERSRLYFDTGMGAGGAGGGGGGGQGGARPGGAAPGAPSGLPALPPAVQAQVAKGQADLLNKGGVDYKTALDQRVNEGIDLTQRIQRSMNVLQNFTPNAAAPMREEYGKNVRAALLALPGVSEQKANAVGDAVAGGSLSAMQEFEKLAATQAMEALRQAMEQGRITQSEYKIFLAANPSTSMNRDTIANIFNFMRNTVQRDYSQQQQMSDYIKQGKPISQWPAEWSKQMLGNNDPLGIRK